MSQTLEAEPVTLHERLAFEVFLSCPLFQRKYVWEKGQIDQLWADIDTVLDGEYERRFLGALVFDDETPSTATQAGRYWIIDGQQRLTTLILTITALAEVALQYGEDGVEFAQGYYEQYLTSRKKQSKNRPKLSPTLRDSKQFKDIMVGAFGEHFDLNLSNLSDSGEVTGKMSAAYRLLKKHVEERTSKVPGEDVSPDSVEVLERLELLGSTLLDRLEFVEIRIGELHDPNEVFDRLNKEGVRLGIIDLVRNEVLKRLQGDAVLAGPSPF